MRYKKIKLAGSGAVNNGRINFKKTYMLTTRINARISTPPFIALSLPSRRHLN
jgi:hypothetical protein